MISQEYLELLRCPQCAGKGKGELKSVKDNWLSCQSCGRQYPVVQGIPVMLPEEGDKWFKLPPEELPDIAEHNRFVND